jgi:hypothetical protein
MPTFMIASMSLPFLSSIYITANVDLHLLPINDVLERT